MIYGPEKIAAQESLKHKELLRIAKESISTIVHDNKFLEAVEKGNLNREQWGVFAVQRYLAATSFEELLRSGIETARAASLLALARELQHNLDDETGVRRESGEYAESESHETWRRDFYAALGVSAEDLRGDAAVLPGGQKYRDTVAAIIERGDAFEIAGAILALEASIPGEFSKIRYGRDKTYLEIFLDNAGDTEEARNDKRKARRYIDDHIVHDRKVHYPELLYALDDAISVDRKQEQQHKIRAGAELVAKARRVFYDELAESLLNETA